MKVPLLDLKGQYAGLRDEIRKVMDEVCDSQYFILGPKVEAFERHVAEYTGVAHAVGVSSGTDALLMALMALEIGPGDAVVTTPYSFFATVGSIMRLGATPVFADIDPVTFNIDPAKTANTLASLSKRGGKLKPKVLLPVHLYGQMADMDPLLDLAKKFGLKVIEDAAQAIGAEYPSNVTTGRDEESCSDACPHASRSNSPDGDIRRYNSFDENMYNVRAGRSKGGAKKAGAMGDMGCFSFFPSKNLGGFGDGGMVATNDSDLAEKLRILRNHGSKPKYYHKLVGGNFRLDALQAAILDVKLKHLEAWHEGRRKNAKRYDSAFEGTAVKAPQPAYAGKGLKNHHIYNQYVVRVSNRDKIIERLKAADVGCEIYYPVPLHLQECFRGLGHKAGDMPESERAASETLALPIYPELTAEMQKYVADVVLRK